MALLNLLFGALFVLLGLFETGGDGDGDDGGAPDKGGAAGGSDDDGGDDDPSDTDDDDGDDDDLAKQARKWKALARKHEAKAKANAKAAAKLAELEDKDKTESQRLTERATTAERDRDDARGKLLRLEVAIEKGLTPAQARRLQGSTKEELEDDADELLDAFGGKGDGDKRDKREPLRRPGGRPRSGSVPNADDEENDPAKLAAQVPRS